MDETRLLLSKVDDAVASLEYQDVAFLGFLNEQEAATVNSYLKNRRLNFTFNGGYSSAKRVYLALYLGESPDYLDDVFPFCAVKVTARAGLRLTHKDCLGALMGLGIKRECVGDIVTEDNYAIIFLRDEISDFVISELTKVGREGVKTFLYEGSTDELCDKFEEKSIIISSMRIDNIVSACLNISRQRAVELISSDKVFLNYSVPSKVSSPVNFGDILSVRGFGKFKVLTQLATTKRDRMVISVLHYI